MESAMGRWSTDSGHFPGSDTIPEAPEEVAVREASVSAPRPAPLGSATNGAAPASPTIAGMVTPLHTVRPTPAPTPAPSRPTPPVPGLAGEERLAQVRELIFGNEMRAYEKRFAEIEDRLVQRISTLQTELVRELATLRQTLEPRIGAVERELAELGEAEERAVEAAREAVEGRVRDMRVEFIGYRKTLEGTIAQVEERVAKGGRQLTQEIVELRHQTAQRLAEVAADADRRIGTVEGRMTDRETLVRGLAELARGLVGKDPHA
ncbi:MAG: hypothetical protein R3E10_07710 [Gemmatimonadota bacterium]